MIRSLIICLPLLFCAPFARADDDTWHNVYHSLKHFGHHVKNKFTDDDDHESNSSSESHHRTSHKSASTTKKAKETPSPSPSPEDTAVGAPTPTPAPMPTAVKPIAPSPSPDATAAPSPSPAEARPQPTAPLVNPAPSPDKDETRNESKSAPSTAEEKKSGNANVASLKPEDLTEFSSQPEKVRKLVRDALALTAKGLNYQYGSSDPAAGGMDCSGYIYYVLTQAGYSDVPRQSSDQYAWVRKDSDFHSVLSRNQDTFELKQLRPGDLMFWSGTYKADRDIPITHVMIYLGTEKATGKPVMVGATDGRTYDGIRRSGVSVFDFKMPSGKANKNDPDLVAKFEGYGTVPGVRGESVAFVDRAESAKSPVQPAPRKNKTIKKKQIKKEE